MYSNQFDTLTRTLAAARSRRRALAFALGGVVTFGLAGSDDVAARGKCKKKCSECKRCKRGKNGKKGTCKPKPDGIVCSVGFCQNGSCAVLTPPSPPPCGAGVPCLAFLSSATYDGNLGGLNGADAKCQGLATAAGLPGIYKAWLSDDTNSPSTRFVLSSSPYHLVTGKPTAADFTDLTDGTLLASIRVTEKGGGTGTTVYAWTNTKSDGTRDTATGHCANWGPFAAGSQGNVGDATLSSPSWTKSTTAACGTPRHLYCFQQS